MSSSMPYSLIIAWVIFFGLVNTHQRHAMNYRGESQSYLHALKTSVLFGRLVNLGLLGYYFMLAEWYWPVALFVIGSLIGGFLFGFLDAAIGQFTMSLLAFIGWPASAIWAFLIIHDIQYSPLVI